MKTKHTHQGTCQACGARQAVDNRTGIVAKHGYKVAGFGMFVGICQGSGKKPAELDITYTHYIMTQCEEWAVEADRVAGLWRDGSLMVTTQETDSGRKDSKMRRIYHHTMMLGCSDYDIGQRRAHLEYSQESQAKNARMHAESLLTHVVPRFGRPLYKAQTIKIPRVFKVGEQVTLYGKAFIVDVPEVHGYRAMYVKGHYATDTSDNPRRFTPSMRTLRGQNP